MSRKGGAGGFDPHPGDPWHPDWTPEKDESDADLFIEEAEPLVVDEGDDGGLLSRFRSRRSRKDEGATDPEYAEVAQDHETEIPDFAADGSSSVESVYDALRDQTDDEADLEAALPDRPSDGAEALQAAEPLIEPVVPAATVEDLETASREAGARFAAEARTATESHVLADATALSIALGTVDEIGSRHREIEAVEAARVEAERIEAERLAAEVEAEAAEAARIEAERLEVERLAAEAEAERIQAERLEEERQAEAERLAAEVEAERLAAEVEAERLEAEHVEAERVEAERVEAERLAAEAEAERVEAERVEAERVEAEAERVEAERLEAERVEAERLEAERVEALAAEVEAERLEAERVEAERLEAERVEAERLEAERVEAERVEAERTAAEEAGAAAALIAAEAARAHKSQTATELSAALDEVERVNVEARASEDAVDELERLAVLDEATLEAETAEEAPLEAERLAAEEVRAEAERLERERVEAERLAAEEARAEAERLERERVEAERLAAEEARAEAERVEAERLAAEEARAEAERLERERVEMARLAAEQEAQRAEDRLAAAEAAARAALAAAPLIVKQRLAERKAADAALRESQITREVEPKVEPAAIATPLRPVDQPELFVEEPASAEPAATQELSAEDSVAPDAGLDQADDPHDDVATTPDEADADANGEPVSDAVEMTITTPLEAELVADASEIEVELVDAESVLDLDEVDDADHIDTDEPGDELADRSVTEMASEEVVPEEPAHEPDAVEVDLSVDLTIEESAGALIFGEAEETPVDVDLGLEEAAGDTVFQTQEGSAEADDWAAYVEGYSAETEAPAESRTGLLSRMFGRRRRKKALAAKAASSATPGPLAEAPQPEMVPVDDADEDNDATETMADVAVEGDDPAVAQPIPLDGSFEAYEHIEAGAFESGGSDGLEGEHDAQDDVDDPVADADADADADAAQPDVAGVASFDDEEPDGPELEALADVPVDDALPEPGYDNLLEAGLTPGADDDIESWDWDDEDNAAATRDVDVEDELAQLDEAVASDMAEEAADVPMAVDEPGAETEGEAAQLDVEDDSREDGPGKDDSGDTSTAGDESDTAWDEFTAERYVRASTAEHAGLAEAMERAATEETEQIAISASMPGVESGLVGLEDVVAASGEDVGTIAPRAKSDLPVRVATAILLIGAFFASLLWRPAIGLFVVAVIAVAAAEFYTVLTNSGHNPLTLFGLAGVIGAMLGTWAWGPVAIPATIAVTLVASLIYYGIVVGRRDPLSNLALTVMGVGWIGGAGALVFELINAVEYQWLMVALVVTVALSDVAQYFTGRNFGKRPLAPMVSPKKTVEGLVGGILVALLFGAALSLMDAFSLQEGLITGAIVAVFAPIGDLAVSVVKRTIGIKDMGVILPGHGGVLDRIDAMIFTVPALWIAWSWLGLLA